MPVADLQGLVDAIANFTRSGLPGTISQLTMPISGSSMYRALHAISKL